MVRSTGRLAATVLAAAGWGLTAVAGAQAASPGSRGAHALARKIERAARADGHGQGVAIDRTHGRGVETLTAWYVAKPGSYADSGAYRLRVVTSGHTLLSVSAASFGQAHSYVAGQTPENGATFLIRFVRVTVRGRAQWELREHENSDSCGYHAARTAPTEPCRGGGFAREAHDPSVAEVAECKRGVDALISEARRHAPV